MRMANWPTLQSSPEGLFPVHHVAVWVRDLDQAEGFYGRVLGLSVQRRWAEDGGAPRSIWFALGGGAFLAVERAPTGGPIGPRDATGLHCVVLGIARSQRGELRDHLVLAGVAIERESAFTLYVRDPEGNVIGFSHYPDPAEVPLPSQPEAGAKAYENPPHR